MKNRKIIYYLIVLFPILDLITSIITRNYHCGITPGTIIKGLFMLYLLFYILKSKSKYKKVSIIFIIIFMLYTIGYFVLKPDLLTHGYVFTEVKYLFKLFYFPIIFLGLLCFYDDYEFNKKEIIELFKTTLIVDVSLLIIPLIFNSAYTTYPDVFKGYIGWFYSGNEVSSILISLLPFMYYFLSKNEYSIFWTLPAIFVTFMIGTKVSLLGLIAVVIITFFYSEIYAKKNIKQIVNPCLIILLIVLVMTNFSFTKYNYNYQINHKDVTMTKTTLKVDVKNTKEVKSIINQINKFYSENKFNKVFKVLLNGRDIYLANTISIYNNDKSNADIWFGIGFSNTKQVQNYNIAKLIEIDYLDAYFHFGIIGLLIMFMPFLLSLYFIIKSHKKITIESTYFILIILLMIGISSFSGHTLMSPAVSLYIILYILLVMNEFKCIKTVKLKEKVSILSLHMGYGGIERSITNQANMISSYYDTDIICLYKLYDKVPYTLDDKVNLCYLSNLKPNKSEFLECFHRKEVLKVIKEGFKATYILFMKKYLIKNYILYSDSKYIISTRLEFTELLNKYGNQESIKIAEEHVYHKNNINYIYRLRNALENIDYLIPASKYLTDDYQKYFANEKVKVVYIPQTIDSYQKDVNKYNYKNIITVGRFDSVKGYDDLIDIMKIVVSKDKAVKLTMVGDGPETNNLKKLIKNAKLEKNIILTGFLDSKSLEKEYKKASLFVMTSKEESFGLVLIEAMSYGLPCIAFDDALGAKEIIDKTTGIIVHNRNKDEYAADIIDILSEHEKLAKMGKEAHNKAKEYTTDKVKADWKRFLKKGD
jgi:glycosyltransferase involved in cell wall biosynthesis